MVGEEVETPHHPGLHHHPALQAAQEVEGGVDGGGGEDSVVSGSPPSLCVYTVWELITECTPWFQAGNSPHSVWVEKNCSDSGLIRLWGCAIERERYQVSVFSID